MTDRLSQGDFRELVQADRGPAVSIYLPTHRSGREIAQDPIRLKNLLRSAAAQLDQQGAGPEMLAQAAALVDDSSFWRHQSDGLAIFASESAFYRFRLPVVFPELANVASRYHIKPLFRYLNSSARFYLLAFSRNRVRFFEGGPTGIDKCDVPGLPESMSDAVPAVETEEHLQFHTQTAAGTGGRRAAVFHGHGDGNDEPAERLLQFCRACDKALSARLSGEKAPLLLASVEECIPVYRKVNSYPHLEEESLTGNPDRIPEDELHAKAWEVMQRRFDGWEDEAVARYAAADSSMVASNLKDVLAACTLGRVDLLFTTLKNQVFGVWHPESLSIEQVDAADGAHDLLDYAAADAYLSGAQVLVMDEGRVPGGGDIAAVLRF